MERSGEWLGGRFRVVCLLGRGPTGEVVEARHGTLDRSCAVKILHPDVTANPERVDAAFADLRAAAALGHPGIVDVFDTDRTDDGRPFFVMELLDGHSLAARVGGGRRLAPAQAVELVGEALATLAVAHRRGLVHGDLKPQNLYVTQSPGERAFVKILDFVASRLLVTGDDRVAQFAAPQFWSPEQAAGGTEIDHRSDVYAMGAVLYVCLTGRSPFDADDPRRTRTRIVSRAFPDPRDVVPGLPDGLAEVVLQATAPRIGASVRRHHSPPSPLPLRGSEGFGVAAGPAGGAFADGRGVPEGDDEEFPCESPAPERTPGRSVGFLLAVVSGPLALAAVIALLLVLQFRGNQTACRRRRRRSSSRPRRCRSAVSRRPRRLAARAGPGRTGARRRGSGAARRAAVAAEPARGRRRIHRWDENRRRGGGRAPRRSTGHRLHFGARLR